MASAGRLSPRHFFGRTVEFFDALPLVIASYLSFGVLHRRVRLVMGRFRGADETPFRVFHHLALAEELGASGPRASGPEVIRHPRSELLGPFPPQLAASGWFQEAPESLREARDLLLAGAAGRAASIAKAEDPTRLVDLFTWAVALRLWAHQHEAAEESAHALGEVLDDPAPARRLLAWVETRRAEESRGPAREEAAARALMHLDLFGPALHRTPAWSVLPVHLALLRRSWLRMEWAIFDARRRLRAAAERHPESAFVHLGRAHLAAAYGDVRQAADHLTHALYHGRGDPYFAAPILCLRGIEALRPRLVVEAKARLSGTPKIDTREGGALESGPSQRGPIP
mgnify:FL=1